MLFAALGLVSCARDSPALPPDLSHLPPGQRLLAGDLESPEAKLDCAQLAEEGGQVRVAMGQNEGQIDSNRGHNQAVAYVGGALFLPLMAATRNDDEAKKALDALQVRRDRIDRLSTARGCQPTAGR